MTTQIDKMFEDALKGNFNIKEFEQYQIDQEIEDAKKENLK